jgi:hypothetical protein
MQMTRLRTAAGLLGTAVLATALVPGSARAEAGQASAACALNLGAVTTAGDHKAQKITASDPVAVTQPVVGPKGLFPVDQVRLASAVGWEPDPPAGMRYSGYATIVNDLYAFEYVVDETSGELDPDSSKKRKIGGGWTLPYTYFEESRYPGRTSTYALRDGVISRWTVDAGVWRNRATYAGYSAVKTMALISQTPTYDTFLATTRGGALYTIRIPLTGAPVVKQVRSSTWQGFETLIAEKCGNQSTLLLGIDKDTRTGYLYAVSHANGTATVIKGLGKVPATFADKTYFRRYGSSPEAPKLYGE